MLNFLLARRGLNCSCELPICSMQWIKSRLIGRGSFAATCLLENRWRRIAANCLKIFGVWHLLPRLYERSHRSLDKRTIALDLIGCDYWTMSGSPPFCLLTRGRGSSSAPALDDVHHDFQRSSGRRRHVLPSSPLQCWPHPARCAHPPPGCP